MSVYSNFISFTITNILNVRTLNTVCIINFNSSVAPKMSAPNVPWTLKFENH